MAGRCQAGYSYVRSPDDGHIGKRSGCPSQLWLAYACMPILLLQYICARLSRTMPEPGTASRGARRRRSQSSCPRLGTHLQCQWHPPRAALCAHLRAKLQYPRRSGSARIEDLTARAAGGHGARGASLAPLHTSPLPAHLQFAYYGLMRRLARMTPAIGPASESRTLVGGRDRRLATACQTEPASEGHRVTSDNDVYLRTLKGRLALLAQIPAATGLDRLIPLPLRAWHAWCAPLPQLYEVPRRTVRAQRRAGRHAPEEDEDDLKENTAVMFTTDQCLTTAQTEFDAVLGRDCQCFPEFGHEKLGYDTRRQLTRRQHHVIEDNVYRGWSIRRRRRVSNIRPTSRRRRGAPSRSSPASWGPGDARVSADYGRARADHTQRLHGPVPRKQQRVDGRNDAPRESRCAASRPAASGRAIIHKNKMHWGIIAYVPSTAAITAERDNSNDHIVRTTRKMGKEYVTGSAARRYRFISFIFGNAANILLFPNLVKYRTFPDHVYQYHYGTEAPPRGQVLYRYMTKSRAHVTGVFRCCRRAGAPNVGS
ncbi:hypothetical protein GGX14DRAFT_609509 [Mycena pura]|uniref:Uncharacterized protein n=1 Tax=Mycena pura TaxID=153505 RepID=A0AAD6VJJ1_9AGAR|nr:hypothetical protein GGX14DRAFT_609509 [Mycena pura]